jgi:hypothetical protein
MYIKTRMNKMDEKTKQLIKKVEELLRYGFEHENFLKGQAPNLKTLIALQIFAKEKNRKHGDL